MIKDAFRQVLDALPVYFRLYLVLTLFLGVIVIASQSTGKPVAWFTRDPVAVLRGNPLTGVVSNIGILLWCATAAVCLLSAFVLRKLQRPAGARFLFVSGAVTLMLTLDDLFMFHEELAPEYLGIPETAVFAAYLLVLGGYVLRHYRDMLHTEYTIWLAACGFLGLSMTLDLFAGHLPYVIEDGLKLFGIATWLLYYARTSIALMVAETAHGTAAVPARPSDGNR